MTIDLETKRWRAVFEGWKLVETPGATRLAGNPKGPFTVEVYLHDPPPASDRPVWKACLIPTRLHLIDAKDSVTRSGKHVRKIKSSFPTAEIAKSFAASHFEKCVSQWQEYADAL